jgi:hypothetical protein
MPILPTLDFPMLTKEQTNPVQAGYGWTQDIISKQLANALAQAQLPYAGPKSAADLLKTQLENQASQIKIPYLDRQEAASTAFAQQQAINEQLQNQWYAKTAQSQIQQRLAEAQNASSEAQWRGPKTRAEIAEANARSGLYGAQATAVPVETLTKAAEQNRLAASRGPLYEARQLLSQYSPAERATLRAHDPAGYDALLNKALNEAMTAAPPGQSSSPRMGALDSAIQKAYPYAAKNMAQPAIQAQAQAPGQASAPNATAQTPQHVFQSTPNQIAENQNVSEAVVNKLLTPVSAEKGAFSAIALDKFVTDNGPFLKSQLQDATKYAGAQGQLKLAKDKVAATLGLPTSPEYNSYIWYENEFTKNMAALSRQMEQAGVSPASVNEFKDAYTSVVKGIGSNPKVAKEGLDRVLATLGKISKSRVDTAEPIFKGVFNKIGLESHIPENYVSGGSVGQKQPASKQDKSDPFGWR